MLCLHTVTGVVYRSRRDTCLSVYVGTCVVGIEVGRRWWLYVVARIHTGVSTCFTLNPMGLTMGLTGVSTRYYYSVCMSSKRMLHA